MSRTAIRWNLRIDPWKTIFLCNQVALGFHVNLCNDIYVNLQGSTFLVRHRFFVEAGWTHAPSEALNQSDLK